VASKPAEQAKQAPAPAPKPKKQAETTFRGWYVQVGSFGQEMNASGLRDRLKAAGYDARLQKAEIGKGYAYRVLVGPTSSRAAAEKNAASLKEKQQLAGMVIEFP
jgi:cell division septation protein DedD